MRVNRIYHPEPLHVGQLVTLGAEASHHLSRVLRCQVNEQVILFNGSGNEFAGHIAEMSKRVVLLHIDACQAIDRESPLAIHLAQAIGKGDKMDWVIQKSCELGVREITPLFTQRSNTKLCGERLDKKHQHWQKVAISACEQCARTIVPKVHYPTTLSIWLESLHCQQGFVLHPHNAANLNDMALKLQDVALLIGPEGGLSDIEIDQASQKGFISLTLGKRILRTETAPIVGITALQCRWGDLV